VKSLEVLISEGFTLSPMDSTYADLIFAVEFLLQQSEFLDPHAASNVLVGGLRSEPLERRSFSIFATGVPDAAVLDIDPLELGPAKAEDNAARDGTAFSICWPRSKFQDSLQYAQKSTF
jgi:hypothetical protein